MLDRRSLISGLFGVTGWLLTATGVRAQQGGTAKVSITITNDADSTLSLTTNQGFQGDPGEFVSSEKPIELSAEVNQDAVTIIENILRVTNDTDGEKTFKIDDYSGPEGVLDFQVDSQSVIALPQSESGGRELSGGESVPLTVAVDMTDHSESVTEEVSLVTESGSASGSESTSGGGGSSCVITTAAASDPATLSSLRRFRDDSMSRSRVGRGLLALYYRLGPPVAATLDQHPESRTRRTVRQIVRGCATLADRQCQTQSRVRSALITATLVTVYAVGGLVGLAGHVIIQATERVQWT